MDIDIFDFVKSCDICQKNKTLKSIRFGMMQSLPYSEEPFDTVSLDTIGGFAAYGSRNRFIHLFIDHATRYIWAYPRKNETADTYIECIEKLENAGKPKTILTDRHPSFLSQKFKHFLKNRKIRHSMTSPQHPESNGMVERCNQTLVTRLRCKINDPINHKKSWPSLLKDCVEEYNKTPHEVTGFAPCTLLYGHMPYNLLINSDFDIKKVRRIAFENSLKYSSKNKAIYDKKKMESTFKIGDEVLYETHWQPNNNKLTPFMMGPYTILEVMSSVTVRIDYKKKGVNDCVVHVSKLRRYISRENKDDSSSYSGDSEVNLAYIFEDGERTFTL